jgi:hypothetical protein
MPQFRTLDLTEARARVRGRTAGSQARAPYREAIANLTASHNLEVEPDPGESMRKVKLNVTQAAKEINRPVEYGVTDEGPLLVWLQEPKRTRRARKTRVVEG